MCPNKPSCPENDVSIAFVHNSRSERVQLESSSCHWVPGDPSPLGPFSIYHSTGHHRAISPMVETASVTVRDKADLDSGLNLYPLSAMVVPANENMLGHIMTEVQHVTHKCILHVHFHYPFRISLRYT